MKKNRVKVKELAGSLLTNATHDRVPFTALFFLGPFGGWSNDQRVKWSGYTRKNGSQCTLIDGEGGSFEGHYWKTFSVHDPLEETARSVLRKYSYVVDDPIIP